MKTFVRLLTLLLACLMLAMTVVACDDDTTEDGQGSAMEEDAYGRERDDLDQYNLNYMGDEVSVLYWSDVENPEFDVEQITSDNVNNALYDRNGEIERRLNVELKFSGVPGNVNNRKGFVSVVDTDYKSQSHAYDLIASYSRTEGMLAIQGFLADLKSIEGSMINEDKPWWPDTLLETVTIGDKMFFLSGDISPNVLHLMQVIYFNKDLLNEYWNTYAQEQGFESDRDENGKEIVSPAARMIYDWAYKGTWTIDKLITLTTAEGIAKDNGTATGVQDIEDQYGFTSIPYCIDCFYTGSNLRLVEETDDGGVLKISDDYGSAKTVKLVNKMSTWFSNPACWTLYDFSYITLFQNGNAMFAGLRAHHVKHFDEDWDYGVMPVPKYDEKQLNYDTCMGNPFTLYGIYDGLDTHGDKPARLAEMTAVIECWASESYRLVTPEVFEVNMQLKYADTQYETDMFEIVRSSVVFDLGRIFANDLSFMSELPSRAAVYHASWSSTYGSYKKSLNAKLEEIVSQLKV